MSSTHPPQYPDLITGLGRGLGVSIFLKVLGNSNSPSGSKLGFMLDNFSNRKPTPGKDMTLPKVTQWLEAELRQDFYGAFVKINEALSSGQINVYEHLVW